MSNPFAAVMQKKTNEQLLKIINSPEGDYQMDAIDAANAEVKTRNLSDAYLKGATQAIAIEQEIKDEKANEPLGNFWKALCFIFPGGIQFGFAAGFKAEGFTRKARETSNWTLYGIGFYLALIILSRYL